MSTHMILFLLIANVLSIVRSRCTHTLLQPEVTVADSEHLLINWEKSFEGCNSREVLSAQVHIGSERVDVTFAEKEAKMKANPCLVHRRILVRVHLEDRIPQSHPFYYNDYNVLPSIEDLYSEGLQNQVVDKACVNEDGELFVPDIPDELKECVVRGNNTRKSTGTSIRSTQLSFTITDPKNENRKKVVKSEFKNDEDCAPHGKTESRDGGVDGRDPKGEAENGQFVIMGVIIGVSVLVITIVIVVVVICSKRKRKKTNLEGRADVNPVYDGAADYEYEYDEMGNYDMGNYDTMEESIRRKKEVKAEVVDRSRVAKCHGYEKFIRVKILAGLL